MLLINGIKIEDNIKDILNTKYKFTSTKNVKREIPDYLVNKPQVISAKCGRQLFVDDFLISKTNLKRIYHQPYNYKRILYPKTKLELSDSQRPVAVTFPDGIFYDSKNKIYKLWYQAGWFNTVGYCESKDGIHFKRINILYDDNRVLNLEKNKHRDGVAIWYKFDEEYPYKIFQFYRNDDKKEFAELLSSKDGCNWQNQSFIKHTGDMTSMFYNTFRKKWVLSVRSQYEKEDFLYRYRSYREADSFSRLAKCNHDYYWQSADEKDCVGYKNDDSVQLYGLQCNQYQSIMIGAFQILKGAGNKECIKTGNPKNTDVYLGYSRDGIHFYRPVTKPFIKGSKKNNWYKNYIIPTNGIFIEKDDEIYIYFGCFSGRNKELKKDMYAGGNVGMCKLRKDGFCSMSTKNTGYLLTEKIIFKGKNLYINADCKNIKIEIRNIDNMPIYGFTLKDCVSTEVHSTSYLIKWSLNLSMLNNIPVRLYFEITNGSLYSFEVR